MLIDNADRYFCRVNADPYFPGSLPCEIQHGIGLLGEGKRN